MIGSSMVSRICSCFTTCARGSPTGLSSRAVQGTGKGVKILVPAAQTIDVEHLDDLLAVAASQKATIGFEGSAWTMTTGIERAAADRGARVPLAIASGLISGPRTELSDRILQGLLLHTSGRVQAAARPINQ